MMSNNRHQPQCFRPPIRHRQHINAKRVLQTRLLIKHVAEIIHIRTLFQIQYNANTLFRGLVGNIHNISRLLCLHQMVNIHKKFSDICPHHCIRNFRDYQTLPAPFGLFHFDLAAQFDFPGSALINLQKIVLVDDDSSGWKIRSLDIFHHLGRRNIRIFHISFDALKHFGKIMGRNARRHTDGNSFGAIYQQIGHPHRQYGRLFLRLIKIGHEVYHILVQIRKVCFLRHFFKTRLRITHRRRSVTLNGAEIPMSIHKRKALLKILRHNYQRFINGTVPMGMILTHGIAHNTGRLPVGLIMPQPKLTHVIQHPSLHRLQSVSGIRNGPRCDYTHRIIQIAPLHLL